ncbi:MAG: membrane-bound lytic murein transglycosylase MltF [Wenzhouxiangellaceae bacterium]
MILVHIDARVGDPCSAAETVTRISPVAYWRRFGGAALSIRSALTPSSTCVSHRWWAALLFACLMPLITSGRPPSTLEQILERGELVLITRSGATTYYLGHDEQPAGFEYDLAAAFAEWLGVGLRVVESERFNQLFPRLRRGQGDLIAANLAITPQRRTQVRFSEAYGHAQAHIVYRRGEPRPRQPADLLQGRIAVIAGSSYATLLRQLQRDEPRLSWTEVADVSIEDLLNAVNEGELDYTLIDDNLLQLNAPFFPQVRRGFPVGSQRPIAWALSKSGDGSLLLASRQFIRHSKQNDTIAQLRQRYYDNLDDYQKIATFTYLERVRQRLPRLRQIFEAAADEVDMDWRMLAAIGYQESHWDPDAISPTGVRGVMMLTQITARQLGVTNRSDPSQSIFGGARYLKSMMDRLPARIPEPERRWFALAAYNVGLGHLEDARILTERQGGNPDSWNDVSERLPLLARKAHYSKLKYGYARGHTAVKYVERIRAYYDILVWMDLREHPLLAMQDSDEPSNTIRHRRSSGNVNHQKSATVTAD